jgi:hypothetical protein
MPGSARPTEPAASEWIPGRISHRFVPVRSQSTPSPRTRPSPPLGRRRRERERRSGHIPPSVPRAALRGRMTSCASGPVVPAPIRRGSPRSRRGWCLSLGKARRGPPRGGRPPADHRRPPDPPRADSRHRIRSREGHRDVIHPEIATGAGTIRSRWNRCGPDPSAGGDRAGRWGCSRRAERSPPYPGRPGRRLPTHGDRRIPGSARRPDPDLPGPIPARPPGAGGLPWATPSTGPPGLPGDLRPRGRDGFTMRPPARPAGKPTTGERLTPGHRTGEPVAPTTSTRPASADNPSSDPAAAGPRAASVTYTIASNQPRSQ